MKKVAVLVKKEIRDILRDKKTLIIMVAVPLLLYPLLIIGIAFGASIFWQSQSEQVHTVAYGEDGAGVAVRLRELYLENQDELGWTLEFLMPESAQEGQEAQKEQKAQDEADVRLDTKRQEDGVISVRISYLSTDGSSSETVQALEELLDLYKEELLAENLRQEGLDETVLNPVVYEKEDQATLSESVGMDIGGSIGMLLIVTILLGAVYPAIDATAGEKERGTLETLLTLPVTNFQMILSKFLSVALFACVTAVLSLISLGGSVLFLMYGIAAPAAGSLPGLSAAALLQYGPPLLLTLLVTALLATAICMCFCVFAKSFKEANNYVTPVLLIVMFASMTAMIPTVRLDYRTALIPVVNVSLMVKELIAQQLSFSLTVLVIAVNLAYSVLIVWILARMYDSEAILFSDGFRSFRFFQKRADIKKGTVPQTGDLILAIAVLLLLMLYVGSSVSARSVAAGAALNQLLILCVPAGIVWYMKSDWKTLFSVRKPRKGSIAGSVFLYAGAYCLMLVAAAFMIRLMPQSAERLQGGLGALFEAPGAVLFFIVAVMPAIGEEIFFRGLLYGSLRENLRSPSAAILLSAIVFSAFHMSLVKLPSTFLLGIVLAYLVWKSGSIIPSMVFHCLNNTLSVLCGIFPEKIGKIAPVLVKETLSAAELAILAAAGAALTVCGLCLLGKMRKRAA